jgi:hypothetical protein
VVDEQSATPRLVFRDKPKPDESYLGFLIRLAEINSYTPSQILQEAHLSRYTFSESSSCSFSSNPGLVLVSLAHLNGLKVEDLTQLVHPRIDENTVTAFGHRLSRYLLTQQRSKVCPACLCQSNHCRKQWDFAVVTSCPVHRHMLMDECHECGKPIKWARLAVSLCVCGADWRNAQLPSLPDSETVVSRLVFQRFGFLPRKGSDSKDNPLYNLPLASALDGLFLIAGQYDQPVTVSGRLLLSKKKVQQIHDELLRALLVFDAWPKNFYTFLDELCRHNKSLKEKSGLRNNFGGVYQALYDPRSPHLSAPLSQLLKTEFETYVLDRWDDGYANRAKCFRSARSEGKYVNMLKASHLLRIHPHAVHRLVSEGKLNAIVRKTGRTTLFLVEARSLEKLRKERARYVSLEEASRLLGISQLNILSLVDKSLLTGAEAPSASNHHTWRFEKVALQGFLNNVLAKTAKRSRQVRRELHSFRTVLNLLTRQLSSSGEGIHTLIEDIGTGVLTPSAKSNNKVGVAALSFDRNEVNIYLQMKLASRAVVAFRVIGLIKELGLKSELVYFLVKKGLIKTTAGKNGNQRCRIITHKAISKFKSEFIFAKDAADEIGTSTKFLVNGLHNLGITPVSGRAIDLGPAYIFRRADLEPINLKKVIGSLPKKLLLEKPRIINSAEAAKILSVSERAIPELIRNGVVKPYKRSSDSKDYFFYRRTIERCKRQFVNLDELISTNAAARLLQMKRGRLFYVWIGRGYLKFEVSRDGHQRLLKKSEVEQLATFLKDVVNMREAAALLNVPYEYIGTWTKREWLKPLPNPYPRAFKSHIYSKTALANLRVNHQAIGIHKKTLLPVSTKV